MCEQLGDIPSIDKLPLDIVDFPNIVLEAFDIHSRLGDRFATTELGLLFLGKDYTSLPLLFKYMNINIDNEAIIFELIQFIDSKAIIKSNKNLQAAAKKLKNKSK